MAEQNSVDLAWGMLLSDSFAALRDAICPTPEELQQFRQLVVNIVMATDIMDKDLIKLRNDRWETAFSENDDGSSDRDKTNRKATIVLKHLIQASDVWHIYQKWNELLFEELSDAYHNGRAAKDPAEFWYEGELAFFDNYIIPLAKKLRNCGVFGVSSDEYLNYALRNREEFELLGKELVAAMVEKRKSSPRG